MEKHGWANIVYPSYRAISFRHVRTLTFSPVSPKEIEYYLGADVDVM